MAYLAVSLLYIISASQLSKSSPQAVCRPPSRPKSFAVRQLLLQRFQPCLAQSLSTDLQASIKLTSTPPPAALYEPPLLLTTLPTGHSAPLLPLRSRTLSLGNPARSSSQHHHY